MKYDFDEIIDRKGSSSVKWDFSENFFKQKVTIPMWVADMDFRSPQPVIDAIKATAEFGIFGYYGVPESYYQAVIGWMTRRHNWEIKKDWIVLTPGVVPAIKLLVRTFVQPGEQVILQTPVYYPFFAAVKDNGCEVLDNPLTWQGEQYVMDITDLERKINSKTRMLILCSPHNPITRVWLKDELERLGALCIKHNIVIIADEIHSDLVYQGRKHIPFATINSSFADHTITCTAASKTFNLPGLRTSNIIISNPELKQRFTDTMKSCAMTGVNMFGLVATEAAYKYGEEWLKQLLEYLQGNAEFVRHFIKQELPGVRMTLPQGTYLLWLDFRACGVPTDSIRTCIIDDASVGVEPGALFGCPEEGFMRMNIACPRSILVEGLERIADAVKKRIPNF